MKDQLQFLLDGANVRRYHTIPTLLTETVGHHSHGVALLACMLAEEPTVGLIFAALVHDLAEHQLGDIPSPAKREYGIGEQVNELEKRLLNDSGWGMERLTAQEKRILKLADIAQGALFCVEEIQRGNSKMRVVYDRYISYAESMILVGFEKTLFNHIKEKLS